jgi:hypothetical protein
MSPTRPLPKVRAVEGLRRAETSWGLTASQKMDALPPPKVQTRSGRHM